MYDLEITIRRSGRPFRITRIQNGTRAKEIVESFLAAWGFPAPASLQDTGSSTFAEWLAEAGAYREDGPGYVVDIKCTA